jgi:purine catabolism regulator
MLSATPSPISSASVRNILTLLVSRDATLVAGSEGLDHQVTWALRMRARLPAFESVRGGELALLTLSQLRRLDETLPHLISSLHKEDIAAIAVAAPSREALGDEATALANQLHLPLILLPPNVSLEEIEREVITFVVSFRGESERRANELSHHMMQLSVQGAGIAGLCEHLAANCGKWVIVQDDHLNIRYQATPPGSQSLDLPSHLTEETLYQMGLARITGPIQIGHELVGSLSLVSRESNFDYLERLILGLVAPILALEFARERERSEVESRYSAEALMDVLQGNYQQAEEMIARARLLGYDLAVPQVVAVFELSPEEPDYPPENPRSQWHKRLRDELVRIWPSGWISMEPRRITALLPFQDNDLFSERTSEQTILTRLERATSRVQQAPRYSAGIGRLATGIIAIPHAYREAQQALEIGRKLFGDGKLHSFSQLGIYRLLFYLYGHEELTNFYQETLGPLLDAGSNNALLETLEEFFHYNGNLSETARAMHLHRNSLLYRLGRIEELLGRSLEDAELRLSLQIALKIRHLLRR